MDWYDIINIWLMDWYDISSIWFNGELVYYQYLIGGLVYHQCWLVDWYIISVDWWTGMILSVSDWWIGMVLSVSDWWTGMVFSVAGWWSEHLLTVTVPILFNNLTARMVTCQQVDRCVIRNDILYVRVMFSEWQPYCEDNGR